MSGLTLKFSLTFQNLLTKFIEDTKVITPISTVKFSYKDEDFNDPIITDQDFEFMKFLTKDSEFWDVLQKFNLNKS
jgi:hypothetical protein